MQLQEVVDHIDNLNSIQPTLFCLGLQHAEVATKLGQSRFTLARYWDAMGEAIVFCMAEGQKLRGIYGAWRILVCWMINQMRDGLMSASLLCSVQLLQDTATAVTELETKPILDAKCVRLGTLV